MQGTQRSSNDQHCAKSWTELVLEQVTRGNLAGATCGLYANNDEDHTAVETLCVCGRSSRRHSFTGTVAEKALRNDKKWIVSSHAVDAGVNVYGQLADGTRVSHRSSDTTCDHGQAVFLQNSSFGAIRKTMRSRLWLN